MHAYVHCRFTNNSQYMEQPTCPLKDKERKCGTYIQEYYWALQKKFLPFVTTWMNLENIMLSEITNRIRQISYDYNYLWNQNLSNTSQMILSHILKTKKKCYKIVSQILVCFWSVPFLFCQQKFPWLSNFLFVKAFISTKLQLELVGKQIELTVSINLRFLSMKMLNIYKHPINTFYNSINSVVNF